MASETLRASDPQKIFRSELRALYAGGNNALSGTTPEALSYAELFENKLLMVMLIQHGLSYTFFKLVRGLAPFNDGDWAELLGVSLKTLQRYQQAERSFKFKPSQSERILEMAEVTQLGLEVFGDVEKFGLWLHTPSFALGNLVPFDLLKDSYGKELVVGELTRVHHGIFV